MTHVERPAVRIQQGNLTIYLTYVTPRDLFNNDFYTVEKLEPTNRVGFQRILDKKRAGRLERHLKEAMEEGYAHLPTTVFLATDKSLEFDDSAGLLSFDTDVVCPFSVVDGQHRIEGLRLASVDNESLMDFQLPTTIATGQDYAHQMYHFYIVNTTQVPVNQSLNQQITRQFTEMKDVDQLPYLPHWLGKRVDARRDARALRIVDELNGNTASPLHGRIQMANEAPRRNSIKQSTLVNIVKGDILTAANPVEGQEATDPDRQARIIINYMQAIDRLLVGGRDSNATTVYKSNGLIFAFGISRWVFNRIYSTGADLTVDSQATCLAEGFEAMDEASAGQTSVGDPEWWMPGPFGAASLNRAGVRALIDRFRYGLASLRQGEVQL